MHETAKIIAKSQNQYPDFSLVEFIIGTIITTASPPLKPKLSRRLGFSQVFFGLVKAAVPPPLKGAKPPYGDLLRKLRLSPRNVSFFQLPYARHRSFSPKPPSEPSQNPKARGNWEGIGDFCLQKCQRGRQLSPLSEATSLDSAATPRAVFLNLFWDSRFKITAKRASLVLRVEFGDRRIGKANRRKGQRPFLKTSETSKASFCLGASN